MNILQHTDEQAPTSMMDVYEHFIGKKVMVFTAGHTPLTGILKDVNANMLHLTNDYGFTDTYVPLNKVVAFSAESDEE